MQRPTQELQGTIGQQNTYILCKKVKQIDYGPQVTLPDSTVIQVNTKGTVPLHPELSSEA
eukprot:7242644-Ditylum_brightwellii.AAC.1